MKSTAFGAASDDTSPKWYPLFSVYWTCYKEVELYQNTVWCHYKAVNLIPNSHNRLPIARPWGRCMGCQLWVSIVIEVLLPSSRYLEWYYDKLDRVITALDCIITMQLFHDESLPIHVFFCILLANPGQAGQISHAVSPCDWTSNTHSSISLALSGGKPQVTVDYLTKGQ